MKTMVILIRNTAGVRCRESASRRVRYGRFDCIRVINFFLANTYISPYQNQVKR